MVGQDALMSNLRHFHLDIKEPQDWMPKNQPTRMLSPGLTELTKGNSVGNRWGWEKPEFDALGGLNCRFCGSKMFKTDETDNAFIFGCSTENCANNPDGKFANWYYKNAKKRMGTITEDCFGTTFQDEPVPQFSKYFNKKKRTVLI